MKTRIIQRREMSRLPSKRAGSGVAEWAAHHLGSWHWASDLSTPAVNSGYIGTNIAGLLRGGARVLR